MSSLKVKEVHHPAYTAAKPVSATTYPNRSPLQQVSYALLVVFNRNRRTRAEVTICATPDDAAAGAGAGAGAGPAIGAADGAGAGEAGEWPSEVPFLGSLGGRYFRGSVLKSASSLPENNPARFLVLRAAMSVLSDTRTYDGGG